MIIEVELLIIVILFFIFIGWLMWFHWSKRRLIKKYKIENDKSKKGGLEKESERYYEGRRDGRRDGRGFGGGELGRRDGRRDGGRISNIPEGYNLKGTESATPKTTSIEPRNAESSNKELLQVSEPFNNGKTKPNVRKNRKSFRDLLRRRKRS